MGLTEYLIFFSFSRRFLSSDNSCDRKFSDEKENRFVSFASQEVARKYEILVNEN